jgi:hypothetical protein
VTEMTRLFPVASHIVHQSNLLQGRLADVQLGKEVVEA